MDWYLQGKGKVLGRKPVSSATSSTTNPILIGQVSKPGLGDRKSRQLTAGTMSQCGCMHFMDIIRVRMTGGCGISHRIQNMQISVEFGIS